MMHITRRLLRVSFVFILAMPAKIAAAQQLPPNYLKLPDKVFSIPLYWQADSVGSTWEAHAALLIPVKIKGCPKKFYMQFDLGSPYSLFYKNKLAAIHSRYPGTKLMNDTSGRLLDFSFKAGSMPVFAKKIAVQQYDGPDINWKKRSVEIIGTIGADLIDGKTVVIDYPGKKLTIGYSIPEKIVQQIFLADFIYANRRILLPATIRGKQTILYFDTGSSMYELLTSKTTCEELAVEGSKLVQNQVRSWNKYLTANTRASNDSMTINGTKIRIHSSTYIDGISAAQTEQMLKMGIGGMTGNKIFLEYKLVLDTKNKKFGLVKGR